MYDQVTLDLRTLQYDYSDCKGAHGPVLQQFTEILNRYQWNFYNWEPVDYSNKPEEKHSLVSDLIFVAIMGVAAFLLGAFAESNFIAAVFYVCAGIALSSRSGSPVWAVLVSAINIALLFLSSLLETDMKTATQAVLGIAVAAYFISAIVKHSAFVKETEEYEKRIKTEKEMLLTTEKELASAREKMVELLPSLFSEYKEKQREIVEKAGLLPDEVDLSWCDTLPSLFWWQITPQDLSNFEAKLAHKEEDDILWETRWVNRSRGKEFPDAGCEYSPLMEITETSEEYKRLYDQTKNEFFVDSSEGCVFDFISRGTSTVTQTETFQYEDYAHSSFSRFAQEMEWESIGRDIDTAYRDKKITEDQYAYLSTAYVVAGSGVYSKINEKVEKTGEKYVPVRTSTNIWVGQMLMAKDTEGGFVVVDYRCRIPHIFKNIEALRDVNVTRVLGDPLKRNPMVMAKFHKECGACL